MDLKSLVKIWFDKWEKGDFLDIPVSDNFKHTSPYGTINGKKEYISIVEANKDQFLGHRFILRDEIYEKDKACVRYATIKDDFSLEVSEWYFAKNGQIDEIISYYNVGGEISDDRKLKDPD